MQKEAIKTLKLIHIRRGNTDYLLWEEVEDEPKVARVGKYTFKKRKPSNKLRRGEFDLSQVLPEYVCTHCGKKFVMSYGVNPQEYAYQIRYVEKHRYKSKKFCSWSCLANWRKLNEVH